MLRRLGIRAKVLAVLAVPVLVLLAIASYITAGSINEARTAATVSDVVAVLPQTARAVEALQQERTLSIQQADDKALGGNLGASRSATDEAVTALGVAVRAVDLSALDPRVQQAVEDATYQHGRLTEFRERLDAGTIPASLVDSNYSDVIASDNNVTSVVAETLSERSLASQLSAYAAIAETIEQVLHAGPVAEDVLADDGADSGRVRELAALFAVQDDIRTEARALTNNLRLGSIQLPSRDADLTAMQLSLTSGNTLTVSALDPTRWNSLTNAELALLRPVATELLDSAAERADSLATQAQEQAVLTIGLVAAAVVLSIFIAFLVSRGIVVPMRRLTEAAGRVREELPRLVEQVAVPGESPDLSLANIPVASQDEVGRLAQAFNDVNSTTIQVAREQAALRGSIAEMFVNVARRDQVLLGRQLAFIDSLERTEEDPETLANLFRLDHLATRMRRNAESLLVLAGIDSGRRLREAMPLSDVVRTASSEIEQYDRVQLDLQADPLMHGFNALGAAHMLAELLENATLFSEPGTPVLVHTFVEDEKVVVRIVDQGLGMSPDELEAANRVISSTSPTEALGAQRLGLFVVARLSQRLGAHVFVKRARGDLSGTAAVVSFPIALFTANDPSLLGGGQTQAQRAAVLPADETAGYTVPEAPVAVPVDLAALTDGATQQGLPRRRITPDAPAEPAEPRSSVPTEQDVVLPAPTEATLSPEIAAEASGWTPLVAPTEPAALPARGSLPSRTPAPAVPADTADDVPAQPAGPRGGLFSGFRGRGLEDAAAGAGAPAEPTATTGGFDAASTGGFDAAPESEPEVGTAPPAAPEAPALPRRASAFDVPAGDVPASIADHEPEVSAADTARLDALSAPLTASLPQVAPAPAPVEEPEAYAAPDAPEVTEADAPVDAEPEVDPNAFVVPGLVPDDSQAWGGAPSWTEPVAPAAPVDEAPAPSWTDTAAPVAPAEQVEPAWSAPGPQAEPEPTWSAPAAAWSEPAASAAPAAPEQQAPVAPMWSAEPQAQ
ncbi:sensor histidine kinase, partial [Cellulomonas triticagri]